MKRFNILIIYALSAAVLFSAGCSKKLEEHPYTTFSVEYFKTTEGFQAGINAVYSGFRFLYGPEGAVAVGTTGTDEWTMADQARAGAAGSILQLSSYNGFTSSDASLLTPWNRSFNNINLANALIEFAPVVPISEQQRNQSLAEIRFLRALYYLNLVQYFGAVPLDLGSGELAFNQKPYQGFNRLPVNEVFEKNYDAIISDLIFATENLTDKRPNNAFVASKASAYSLLAKAYLHRGYSTAKQATDFQNAYNAAMEVINNQSKYGTALQKYYADVHKPDNDYNSEIIFSIERVPGNYAASEVPNPDGISGTKGMDASNDFGGDYTSVSSPTASSSTKPVSTRTVLYGRPIRRFCPTPWLFNVAFADKINDSRYEGTFRTVYIASVDGGGFIKDVDTAFVMALTNAHADSLNAIPKPYRAIAPREFYFINGSTGNFNMYPSMMKYEDPKRGQPNYPGARPYPVVKLSEVYLIAAEAAMQTNQAAQAVILINVLKERAAARPELSAAQITARYNNIRLTSPAQVTLDFILDERTRELAGEGTRWPDLAIRGKLIERTKLYNTDAATNIQPYHALRPIPSNQLDNIVDPDKAKYQNPGY